MQPRLQKGCGMTNIYEPYWVYQRSHRERKTFLSGASIEYRWRVGAKKQTRRWRLEFHIGPPTTWAGFNLSLSLSLTFIRILGKKRFWRRLRRLIRSLSLKSRGSQSRPIISHLSLFFPRPRVPPLSFWESLLLRSWNHYRRLLLLAKHGLRLSRVEIRTESRACRIEEGKKERSSFSFCSIQVSEWGLFLPYFCLWLKSI